ncbi:MAG: DUF2183 domain-containing protein [Bacteriovorax sp.]|nr:DUF2183 domain-containing protein [Bacteriovorax sp.]
MKTKILVLSFLMMTIGQIVQAKTLIVSDVDDTIKMTDVLGKKIKVVLHGVFKEEAFAGMSELYQAMAKKDATVYYVSGSPKIIRFRVIDFLEDNKFPQAKNLILKNKTSDDTYKFKVAAIRELINKIHPDKMILIGDDTEHDSEVYDTISQENPGVVEGIYIRAVQNKALNNQNFFSAVEIAGSELLKGSLNVSDLASVTKGFVEQSHCSGISIKNRYCPADGRAFIEELKQKSTDQKAIDLFEKTQAKISSSCK